MAMKGPLAPWAPGMKERLVTLGYTRRMVERHLQFAGGLSRFLQQRGVTAGDLCPELVGEFVGAIRAKNSSWRPTSKSLSWLVDYLRDAGVATVLVVPRAPSEQQVLVERYRDYLTVERGLEPDTVANYVRVVTLFVTVQAGRGLEELDASDISGFMASQCRQVSARQAERLATGLRSFLGFALVEGLISVPLAGAVPSVARWSGAALPRYLTSKQVAALLASCDRRRALGRRDYAILVLLARLGLRAAEVSALRLDDIEWRAGEIVVRGKGRSEERLPLPPDVGAAIAAYLRRGRPRRPERAVFLRACAPLRELTPDGVSEVVRAASERAELGSFGSHRLRHTAATQMLRAGGSLPEVAQVLRHRTVATTAIYAKVDHLALRGARHALAGEWTMTDYRAAADDYLATRRAMGYKLCYQGQMLVQFVDYLEAVGAEHLTINHALGWAKQPSGAARTWWAVRLSTVRAFARYLSALDPATQIPPAGLISAGSHRIVPYIYTDEDITRLLEAAGRLGSAHRADTYQTVIGLVAVTGMRAGEAVRLDRDDVDLEQGVLTIRNSKHGKSRQVPVHPSSVEALAAYARRRDQRQPRPKAASFFTSTTGTRLLRDNVSTVFPSLVRDAGLDGSGRRRPPRLHDLRHSFAVRSLIRWYRQGLDVEQQLPVLSTYLGHVAPSSTYWYYSDSRVIPMPAPSCA